jgi:aspartyl-tRNA(Asn)/glutamyl-tRNA(Gln) amidotransferase subunit A
VFAGHVPERTAEAVARLEGAGWGLAGKTNLHEFAYGITSQNPHYGTVPNPTAPGHIAGGSSGGSAAALAAGEAEGALGTDSGGSIRIPAACCGVVGFKPTHDLVPLDGCFPLAPSFDTAGPMARSVAACTEMTAALAPGFDPLTLHSLADVRVGLAWTADADPLIRARVEEVAAAFAHLERLDIPHATDAAPAFMAEVADSHRELFAGHRDRYGDNVRIKVQRCLDLDADAAAAGRRARELYRERLAEVFANLDLVITPTLARVPPLADVDELTLRELYVRFTIPFNTTGGPALALPCGIAENGLPASVQVAGPPGADALVLAVGELLERTIRVRSAGAG